MLCICYVFVMVHFLMIVGTFFYDFGYTFDDLGYLGGVTFVHFWVLRGYLRTFWAQRVILGQFPHERRVRFGLFVAPVGYIYIYIY